MWVFSGTTDNITEVQGNHTKCHQKCNVENIVCAQRRAQSQNHPAPVPRDSSTDKDNNLRAMSCTVCPYCIMCLESGFKNAAAPQPPQPLSRVPSVLAPSRTMTWTSSKLFFKGNWIGRNQCDDIICELKRNTMSPFSYLVWLKKRMF